MVAEILVIQAEVYIWFGMLLEIDNAKAIGKPMQHLEIKE